MPQIYDRREHLGETWPAPWAIIYRGPLAGELEPGDIEARRVLVHPVTGEHDTQKVRAFLWKSIREREPRVLAALREITEETTVVYAGADGKRYAETVLSAWAHARSSGLLGDGSETRLVNIRDKGARFQVWIGGDPKSIPAPGVDGWLANPFDGEEDGLENFGVYLRDRARSDEAFRNALDGLKGKALGCTCRDLGKCHGSKVLEYLRGIEADA